MDINNKVYKVLANVFHVKQDTINETTTMSDVGDWNSLSHMELILSLEKEFDIQFTNDEIVELIDVSAIIKTIKEKVS